MSVGSKAARQLILFSLLLSLAGCKTWEPATGAVLRTIGEDRPSSVRVTTVDGEVVTLKNPAVVNDSVVANVAPPPGMVVVPPRRGVLEDDINLIEVARFDSKRTIGIAAVIVGASLSWATIQGVGLGGGDREPPPDKDSAFDLIGLFQLVRGWF